MKESLCSDKPQQFDCDVLAIEIRQLCVADNVSFYRFLVVVVDRVPAYADCSFVIWALMNTPSHVNTRDNVL